MSALTADQRQAIKHFASRMSDTELAMTAGDQRRMAKMTQAQAALWGRLHKMRRAKREREA